MTAKWLQAGVGLLLVVVASGCESSGAKDEPVPDSGTVEDGGAEPSACEKQQGVCAGATRAWVDGAYEPECTARSYGADYEAAETRCDGLDNDCDGVTDPPSRSRVTRLTQPLNGATVASLRTDSGVLVAVTESLDEVRILRLDSKLVLQGSSTVPSPWARTGEPPGVSYNLRLVDTKDGPALYYATGSRTSGPPLRAYLVPLDSSGAPQSQPEGGAVDSLVLDRPLDSGSARMAMSQDGERLMVVWRSSPGPDLPAQLLGTVTDVHGQVLMAPKALFTLPADSNSHAESILWLRNGDVVVVTTEQLPPAMGDTVRLRRFDSNLELLGDERTFTTNNGSMPVLVDLGATRGGPLESPVLVLRNRNPPDWRHEIQVVRNLFGGGVPEFLAEAAIAPEIAYFNAFVDEGALRLAWLAVSKDTSLPSDGSMLGTQGRLWTQDEGHAPADRSPGPERLPLHAYAQWVLMEKLEPRRMGALYMTSTQEGSSLDAVRYCTP
ncbi:hypothetical protein HUA74_36115 [Myxococcus sp. CA051A]|uniref:putative metal-binding motif-containing protein n=1 Tax=unclassified Myxococcus TaxID=2648731 RepID=UPI00157A6A4E|nr:MULTISPECIES: putative metal-binding motif-containing protein [unclassified Myxococcus]NTX58318.1 hypothetical protein [Myxococcus sp. CA039A]NTX66097.1 hypothetical protein [Myxococcus sp. CA051A]